METGKWYISSMSILPILISSEYILLVHEGDSVKIGQILAQRRPHPEIPIPIASELGIQSKDIEKYLSKKPGDSVSAGDILARKKGMFGGTASQVVTKASGIIKAVDHTTGEIILEVENIKNKETGDIVSPLEGTILVCNNEKIVIQTDKGGIPVVKGVGKEATAILKIVDDTDTVDPYFLQSDAIGKIVVGHYFPRDVLAKSVSIGVAGVIGDKILDSDVDFFNGKKIQMPIVEVNSEDIPKLSKWRDKKVYLQGETKTIILLHT